MTRSRPLSFVPAWFAIALLMVAEAFAVVHATDLDAHTGGEACKICLSVSPLDGASPVNGSALPIVVVPDSRVPFVAAGLTTDRRPGRIVARGPPIIS